MEEPSNYLAHLRVIGITGVAAVSCILLHYETLAWLTRVLKRLQIRPRPIRFMAGTQALCGFVLIAWFQFGRAEDTRPSR
jgi:hypothetical protein